MLVYANHAFVLLRVCLVGITGNRMHTFSSGFGVAPNVMGIEAEFFYRFVSLAAFLQFPLMSSLMWSLFLHVDPSRQMVQIQNKDRQC